MVYEAKDRVTNELFACKAISKAKLKSQEDIDHVRKEVLIMHTLLGECSIGSYMYKIDRSAGRLARRI